MNEIKWNNIPWYKWRYQINEIWEIKSLNYNRIWKEKILKQNVNWQWYWLVTLFINWNKKVRSVHRLMWFVYLWLNLNDTHIKVCHKNDIKTDNRLDNLFLWTQKTNILDCIEKWRHITNRFPKKEKINRKKRVSIVQFNLKWDKIKTWNNMYEIQDVLKIPQSNISRCCNWLQKTAKSYVWKFAII